MVHGPTTFCQERPTQGQTHNAAVPVAPPGAANRTKERDKQAEFTLFAPAEASK